MDIYATLDALNRSPERQRAKAARRARRAEVIYDRIGEAVGRPSAVEAAQNKQGQKWNIFNDEDVAAGVPMGDQHPALSAVLVAKQALAQFDLPSQPKMGVDHIRRTSGHGAFKLSEGRIDVNATLRSISGPEHHIVIPIIVKNGRMLHPVVMIHQGQLRILTQQSFDDILSIGTFKRKVPDRINMYAPPAPHAQGGGGGGERREVDIVGQGRYSPSVSRHAAQDELEREAQLKKMLGPALLGLGLGMAPGSAMGAESSPQTSMSQPANTKKFEYGTSKDPKANDKKFEYGHQLDPVQSSELASLKKEIEAAKTAYKGNPMAPFFMKGLRAVTQDAGGSGSGLQDAHQALMQELGAKNMGHQAPLKAFNEGVSIGKKFTRMIELESFGQKGAARVIGSYAQGPRRGFYEPAVTGVVEPGQRGADIPGADGSHLDVAERPTKGMLAPGQRVRTTKEIKVLDRGGGAHTIAKGETGTVVRDDDGAGRAYHVRFEDVGYMAKVPASSIR